MSDVGVEETTVPPHEHEQHVKHKKLVIIASSGNLDDAWAQMIIATAGAAMEMETMIFFTFWGLFSLVRDDVRITGENWMQKMVTAIDRPGAKHLKLGRMNFVGAGPAMMMKLAKEHKVAGPAELLQMAVDMGVKLVPCQMTMDMMGLKREDMIDGVTEPMGATAMLLEAQDAVTFFI